MGLTNFDFTRSRGRLMVDGVEVSRHSDEKEAIEAGLNALEGGASEADFHPGILRIRASRDVAPTPEPDPDPVPDPDPTPDPDPVPEPAVLPESAPQRTFQVVEYNIEPSRVMQSKCGNATRIVLGDPTRTVLE